MDLYDETHGIQDGSDMDGRHNNESFAASVSYLVRIGSTLVIGTMYDSNAAPAVSETVLKLGHVEVYENLD